MGFEIKLFRFEFFLFISLVMLNKFVNFFEFKYIYIENVYNNGIYFIKLFFKVKKMIMFKCLWYMIVYLVIILYYFLEGVKLIKWEEVLCLRLCCI